MSIATVTLESGEVVKVEGEVRPFGPDTPHQAGLWWGSFRTGGVQLELADASTRYAKWKAPCGHNSRTQMAQVVTSGQPSRCSPKTPGHSPAFACPR